MSNKKLRRLITLLLYIGVILLISLPGIADFGDFSGDSDYGYSDSSYDYDYGSDYDYDSDYDGGLFVLFGGQGSLSTIIIIALIVIYLYFRSSKRRASRQSGAPRGGTPRSSTPALRPMSEYLELDPNFDESDLCAKLSNLYVQMQHAWQDKDISPIRPYCSDRFYTQMENQLKQKIELRQTNYIERIAVLGVSLNGFCQKSGSDVIYATVNTRIVDYTLDDATGQLVSGSRTKEKFMCYEWELIRSSGVITEKGKDIDTVNCPNCGAPVSINASAKCPYCGSVITAESHAFVLNSIRGISQQTK